jgi:hypothetical protein
MGPDDSERVAMAAYAGTVGRGRRQGGMLARIFVVLLGLLVSGLAGAPVVYMLWPQRAPIAPDAPSLPITVGGVVFNVPPAAIRNGIQRRPGAQARLDLAFVWPSLAPPDASIKPSPTAAPIVTDRLFVTIAVSDSTLPPLERLKLIYPRYTEAGPVIGKDGLSVQSFRSGSPYRDEDLILDPAATQRFLLRCTRPAGPTPAMCLHERRIGSADVTVRFPRQWLDDWRAVAGGIDQLLAKLQSMAG